MSSTDDAFSFGGESSLGDGALSGVETKEGDQFSADASSLSSSDGGGAGGVVDDDDDDDGESSGVMDDDDSLLRGGVEGSSSLDDDDGSGFFSDGDMHIPTGNSAKDAVRRLLCLLYTSPSPRDRG